MIFNTTHYYILLTISILGILINTINYIDSIVLFMKYDVLYNSFTNIILISISIIALVYSIYKLNDN